MNSETIKGTLGAIIILCLMVMFFTCTGCKVLRSINKTSQDSTISQKEGSLRIDSSGVKTDKTSTKETVYYPQPIYIEGKNGETKVVFVPQSVKESGTEKVEQAQVITDTSWREAFVQLTKTLIEKDTKTKVGPSLIEWMLIAGLGLLLVKNFLPIVRK